MQLSVTVSLTTYLSLERRAWEEYFNTEPHIKKLKQNFQVILKGGDR